MFDMGFTEMMLIGIVALVVIGPERLPGVARTAGKYFGRLKRFMTSVKADVEQELRADELRQILADQKKELDSIKESMNVAGKAFEEDIKSVTDSVEPPAESADQVSSGTQAEIPPGDSESATTAEPEVISKNQAGEVKS